MDAVDPYIKRMAFEAWRLRYKFTWSHFFEDDIDQRLKPYLNLEAHQPWLKAIRKGFMLTSEFVAKQIGLSAQAIRKLEDREAKGTITLNALNKAAAAMNCELIYAIRPKSKLTCDQIMWHELEPLLIEHTKNIRPECRAHAMAQLAEELINDGYFRRTKNWSRTTVRHTIPGLREVYRNKALKVAPSTPK